MEHALSKCEFDNMPIYINIIKQEINNSNNI